MTRDLAWTAADAALSAPVTPSPGPAAAARAFLQVLREWIAAARAARPLGYVSASHDGGTCLVPWAVYIRATGDAGALAFLRRYRDESRRRFLSAGAWRHGYWRRQEAHHGTEHFDLYLDTCWRLASGDEETVRQMEDAAEHIGNWSPAAPPWYDEAGEQFVGMHLGTEVVEPCAVNVPDHLRFVSLLLHAHDMTGRKRYLALADRYAGRWAQAVAAGPILPAALTAAGPVRDLDEDETHAYRSFAGAAPEDLADERMRAENLVANEAPEVFLRLAAKTGRPLYRRAARRLGEVLLPELGSPLAWQVQGLTRLLREEEPAFADAELAALAPGPPPTVLHLDPFPPRGPSRGAVAVGDRNDRPRWRDQEGREPPSPLLLLLLAEARRDPALETRALDLGRTFLSLALAAYGPLCEHGCGARSASAVARGHGRLDGWGVVSGVLAPALARL
jgi:hypothetical protein